MLLLHRHAWHACSPQPEQIERFGGRLAALMNHHGLIMDMDASQALRITRHDAWKALDESEMLELCVRGYDKLQGNEDKLPLPVKP